MNILRYALLWVMSFIFTSLIDAAWHLVIFKKNYVEGIKPMARMNGEKISFKAGPGLLSQVLVVTSLVILVLVAAKDGTPFLAALVGALAGVLAISVYGVTNYSLFRDWNLTLTVLEFIWGPLLGGMSGLFVHWAKSLVIK
jgi:uncharacterized membrane protein